MRKLPKPNAKKFIYKHFPILDWLPKYTLVNFFAHYNLKDLFNRYLLKIFQKSTLLDIDGSRAVCRISLSFRGPK